MDVALEETICDSVKYTLTSWNQHWYSTHKIDIYEINMFLRIYVRTPPPSPPKNQQNLRSFCALRLKIFHRN